MTGEHFLRKTKNEAGQEEGNLRAGPQSEWK